MRSVTATTEVQNRLGLRELLERYANEQRIADRRYSAGVNFKPCRKISLDFFIRTVRHLVCVPQYA